MSEMDQEPSGGSNSRTPDPAGSEADPGLCRWAAKALGGKDIGKPGSLRLRAVEQSIRMLRNPQRPLDIPTIAALHFGLHNRRPSTLLLAGHAASQRHELRRRLADLAPETLADHASVDNLAEVREIAEQGLLNERVIRAAGVARGVKRKGGNELATWIADAWYRFVAAPPGDRPAIMVTLNGQLQSADRATVELTIRQFQKRIAADPEAADFLACLAEPSPGVPRLSQACIAGLVASPAPATAASGEKSGSGNLVFAAVMVAIWVFGILRAIFQNAIDEPVRPHSSPFQQPPPVTSPRLTAEQIMLEQVDESPFQPSAFETLTVLLMARDDPKAADFDRLRENMGEMRRRRWLFREQHMIRCLAQTGRIPEPDATITLFDDGEWETSHPAQAREVIDVFIRPENEWSGAILKLREQADCLNPQFWKSAVVELTSDEIKLVLEGDPARTLELDRRLYTDPVEFELVRRLRDQNVPLDRTPGKAYGHHWRTMDQSDLD